VITLTPKNIPEYQYHSEIFTEENSHLTRIAVEVFEAIYAIIRFRSIHQ